MKNKDYISVIIPVYNVGEKYLRRCIDSVLNQSYKKIEIIIINDGSTDNSDQIILEYANIDNRIKYYNRCNHGVSATRNFGLKKCSGKYITFLDSDDYIELDMYEKMINIAIDKKIDIISSAAFYENENGYIFNDLSNNFNSDVFFDNSNDISRSILFGEFGASLWNKLFSRKLIIDNKILFDEDIHSCEDLLFLIRCAQKSNTSFYLNKSFYHYIKRNNSVTNDKFNPKILSYVNAYNNIYELVKYDENLIDLVHYSKALCTSNVLYRLIDSKQEYKLIKKYISELKLTKKSCHKMMNKLNRENILLFLMFLNPYIATFIWKHYKIFLRFREK